MQNMLLIVYTCTSAVYYTSMLYLHNGIFTDIIHYDRLKFNETYTPQMKSCHLSKSAVHFAGLCFLISYQGTVWQWWEPGNSSESVKELLEVEAPCISST